ncbi:MAG: hypothetical protein R2824_28740 [Saprospiraceae bacterium]
MGSNLTDEGTLIKAINATEKALENRLADEAGAGRPFTAYNLGSAS